MFYTWLLAQRERTDSIGRLSTLALQDPKFPRTHRLCRLLLYYDAHPEHREMMRLAHAEWRRARRVPTV